MNRRTLLKLILAIGAVVVLAACSSGGSSSDGDGSAAGSPGDTTATTAAGSSDNTPVASHAIVESMQKNLKELGHYSGDVDGQYGPKTTEAVKAFQSESGLAVDGRWGPKTHAAMDAALGSDTKSDAIAQIQVEMRTLGFYEGEIDGIYGEETTIAITKAQEACGIELDGVYGPETHACVLDLLKNV